MISDFSEKTVTNSEDEIITEFCKYIIKQRGKNERLERLAESLVQGFVYNIITLNDEQIRIESLKKRENSHTIDSALRLDEVYKKLKEVKNYIKEHNKERLNIEEIFNDLIHKMRNRTMKEKTYNLIDKSKKLDVLIKKVYKIYNLKYK